MGDILKIPANILHKLCGDSEARLSRVMEVLIKVQRQLDLFTRCNIAYNEEKEVKPNMVVVLEHFESILVAMVTHMHKNTNGKFLPSMLSIG